jgi:valyl-tRNA synthetase
MIMAGLHFMGEAPFRTVYIHALVRDERGQKMSKSKGNIIDPIGLIDRFGADALRFTLTAMAAQGRDIKLATSRVEGYRNFATKLWNAARFGEMNACVEKPGFDPNACKQVVNRWILCEMAGAAEKITLALDGFRFNEAADAVYRFIWNIYCDWYLEFIKPVLTAADAGAANECRHTSAYVLHQMLHMLHPFMPFVTEELWRKHVGQGQGLLTLRAWPNFAGLAHDASAALEMNWVIHLVEEIRSVRSEMNVPAAARIDLILQGATARHQSQLAAHTEAIARLARLGQISADGAIPKGSVQIVIDEATAILPLADVIDLAREKDRLNREMAKQHEIGDQLAAKLGRADFVDKAPELVIEEHRERLAQANAAAQRLGLALKRLS